MISFNSVCIISVSIMVFLSRFYCIQLALLQQLTNSHKNNHDQHRGTPNSRNNLPRVPSAPLSTTTQIIYEIILNSTTQNSIPESTTISLSTTQQSMSTASQTTKETVATTLPTTTTTQVFAIDIDEVPSSPQPPEMSTTINPNATFMPNSIDNLTNSNTTDKSPEATNKTNVADAPPRQPPQQPNEFDETLSYQSSHESLATRALVYSIFVVFVALIKLLHSNVLFVRLFVTESGFLMMFGVLWELINRQINIVSTAMYPQFNGQVFFYLFLPSTILESTQIVTNRLFFRHLFYIIVHSIFGTLIFASSLGFAVFAMVKQQQTLSQLISQQQSQQHQQPQQQRQQNQQQQQQQSTTTQTTSLQQSTNIALALNDDLIAADAAAKLNENNLSLADCLVLGIILSSIDFSSALVSFNVLDSSAKLYYVALTESLFNNAIVIVVFNLLLDFFYETKLTVSKIYITILKFLATILGSMLLGIATSSLSLLAVRLNRRFSQIGTMTWYQNKCLSMVETLLIIKSAYLTYNLGDYLRFSGIISLLTFGVVKNQYIELNIDLRSRETIRQIVLALKTLGTSLVYPLLGVSLAKKIAYSRYFLGIWDMHFISTIIILAILFRFATFFCLTNACNLVTSSNAAKINLKEQLVLSFGGLKGPLTLALVHRLMQHEEYNILSKARIKYLFAYLVIILISMSAVQGCFINWLIVKLNLQGNTSFKSLFSIFRQQNNKHEKDSQHIVITSNLSKSNRVLNSDYESKTKTVSTTNSAFARSDHSFQSRVSHGFVGSETLRNINGRLDDYIEEIANSMIGKQSTLVDKLIHFNDTKIKPLLIRGNHRQSEWLNTLFEDFMLDNNLLSQAQPTQHAGLQDQLAINLRASSALQQSLNFDRKMTSDRYLNPISLIPGRQTSASSHMLSDFELEADKRSAAADLRLRNRRLQQQLQTHQAPQSQRRRRQRKLSVIPETSLLSQSRKHTLAISAFRGYDSSEFETGPLSALNPRKLKKQISQANETAIKELVVYDLKLADKSGRRFETATRSKLTSSNESGRRRKTPTLSEVKQQTATQRMLSTTSSEELINNPTGSTKDSNKALIHNMERQMQLRNLERAHKQ